MSLPSAVHVLTGLPSNETTLSPACRPAAFAGDGASAAVHVPVPKALAFAGTHELTGPSWVVLLLSSPITPASRNSSTKARTKCMNDPANSTIRRCQAGCRRNERGSSAGSTSSMEVMPVILTNPPNGRTLIPYSVSPRRVDHSVVPKPTKYWVTFMPNFLAVTKCPVSCSITEKSRATMKMTQPSRLTAAPASSSGLSLAV